MSTDNESPDVQGQLESAVSTLSYTANETDALALKYHRYLSKGRHHMLLADLAELRGWLTSASAKLTEAIDTMGKEITNDLHNATE